MKRILLTIATSMLLIFLATIPSHANPYCTFRGGNCVYFHMGMRRFLLGHDSKHTLRDWDAYRWVDRAGAGRFYR